MKIFGDILKQAAIRNKPMRANLQVMDTVSDFWQQVNNDNLQAQVFEASSLLPGFSKLAPHSNYFERDMKFGDLSPLNQVLWIEMADAELAANLAVSLTYTEKNRQAIEQAERYGLKNSFKWICKARSFLKEQHQPTLPLKWQWVEYIDAAGASVSSLLEPLQFPEYIGRKLETEGESFAFIHHQLCAFIANLGLYTVDLLNKQQVMATACTTKQFSYQVIEMKEGFLPDG